MNSGFPQQHTNRGPHWQAAAIATSIVEIPAKSLSGAGFANYVFFE
jgi:hypothetical protein